MTDYKDILTAAVQNEMKVVGEKTALKIARSVEGVSVNDQGEVTNFSGEGPETLSDLVEAYTDFSPVSKHLIKREVDVLFENNPALEKPEIIS